MKKSIVAAIMMTISISGFSQDIYQVAELGTSDLVGTSRYVGMGGAMGALGGDLSLMSSSPAAIALYRHSDAAATLSLVTQTKGEKFDGKNKTHVSFDQAGFVYAMPMRDSKIQFLNFGFNYHKQRNFNQLTASTATNLEGLDYASQTWQLSDICRYWGGYNGATPLGRMATDLLLLDENNNFDSYRASSHFYNKARWGGNQAFDFNFSINFNDQVYIGLTGTGYVTKMKSYMGYTEDLIDENKIPDGYYTLTNEGTLEGTGGDLKLGLIVRPVRESNFKIGFTLTTPTYYDLTYRNTAWLSTYENQWSNDDAPFYCDYDYKIRTPWKLNLSLGNTFFNRLAVGAEYEFADYSSTKISYGDTYDDWYTTKDVALTSEAHKLLNSTHTLKVGAELMVNKNLFLRGGYNYVSSTIDKDAFLNQYINSRSLDDNTYTDFLNTKAINRFTVGLGMKFGSFYADAAWQYQKQNADLYTFAASEDGSELFSNSQNVCPARKVNLNRSQFQLTLGYRF